MSNISIRKLNNILASMNSAQKIIISFFGILFIGLIALHNPVDGYSDVTYSIVDKKYGGFISIGEGLYDRYLHPSEQLNLYDKCMPILSQEAAARMSGDVKMQETYSRRFQALGCDESHFLPISEWRSLEPAIPWLGSVVHVMWAIIVSVLVFAFLLFVSKERSV